jgi:tetratricopeptide (TPR) repeat protein
MISISTTIAYLGISQCKIQNLKSKMGLVGAILCQQNRHTSTSTNHIPIRWLLGSFLIGIWRLHPLNSMKKSLPNLNQPLIVNPDDSADWYRRGEALANLGNYDQALDCFNRAVEIQPSHHAAWIFRGVVLIHLLRYEEALASCNRAIEVAPRDPEAWIFRGVALQRLSRYPEAYASYDRALGIRRQSIWHKLIQRLRSTWSLLISDR